MQPGHRPDPKETSADEHHRSRPREDRVRTLRNYVGGRWVDSSSSDYLDITNPATGDVLARVPLSSKEELDDAARTAKEASKTWRKVSVIERRAGSTTSGRRSSTAPTTSPPRSRARWARRIPTRRPRSARSIENIEAACGVPTMMQGHILEGVATAIDCETIRQPVGVVADIVPFNFPAMVPVLVPALRDRVRQRLHAEASSRCR